MKHISRCREWDDVTPLATASYNWLCNQHSRESPFLVMFGRDVLTNLHLILPNLRYMCTSDLILYLELMSNIYQVQIHNLKLARQHVIEDQRLVPNPKIKTGNLVFVKDYTSTTFMPKYKTDFHVFRILGNKVEVKDNNSKKSWSHTTEMKKIDMVTKLICQLPDYDAFGRKGRLSFDPEHVQDLGWTPQDQDFKFNLDHVSDIPAKQPVKATQRSHPMQLRSAPVNGISGTKTRFNPFNIAQLLQNNSVLTWVNN